MTINHKNYFQTIEKIGVDTLPKKLLETHQLIEEKTNGGSAWVVYHTQTKMKKKINDHFEQLEKHLGSGKKSASSKAKMEVSHNAKKKTENSTKSTPKSSRKRSFSLEEEIIKDFAKFHDSIVTDSAVIKLHEKLENAKIEGRITKSNAKHPKLLNQIAETLVDWINQFSKAGATESEVKLPADLLAECKEATEHIEIYASIPFLKKYVRLHGKPIKKFTAKNLYNKVAEAANSGTISKNDKYWNDIVEMMEKLRKFVESTKVSGILTLDDSEITALNGFMPVPRKKRKSNADISSSTVDGLGKLNMEQPVAPTDGGIIMNSNDILNLKFEKLGFKGKWRDLMGDPSPGFAAMISGKPKFGKSYLAVEFAGYLARNHGRVLYVAREEGIDDTLQAKLKEKDVAHENLFVSDYIPYDQIADFDFVFLDSVTKLQLTPFDLDELRRLLPKVSFVFIFQVTKDGMFRGQNDFAHDMDILIEVIKKGVAIQNGRFNQGGELLIFPDQQEESNAPFDDKGEKAQLLDGLLGAVGDSFPKWTKPEHLTSQDHDDLAWVHILVKQGKLEEAMEYASRLDTIVRDEIPQTLWKKLGGEVINEKTKLKERMEQNKYPEWVLKRGFSDESRKKLKQLFDHLEADNFSSSSKLLLKLEEHIQEAVPQYVWLEILEWMSKARNKPAYKSPKKRKKAKFDRDKYKGRPDDMNPIYLFQTVPPKLLAEILRDDIDLLYLIRNELANQGLDENGEWVGFKKARKSHGLDGLRKGGKKVNLNIIRMTKAAEIAKSSGMSLEEYASLHPDTQKELAATYVEANATDDEVFSIDTAFSYSMRDMAREFLPKGYESEIQYFMDENPLKVQKFINNEIRGELEGTGVTLKSAVLSERDTNDHHIVWYEVELEGTMSELKKVAGEDKVFAYSWNLDKEDLNG